MEILPPKPESPLLENIAPKAKEGFFKHWRPLIILALALMTLVIDTTLLNVSIGTIIVDLKTNIKDMQWVISAYTLFLAALTITGGRLGDIFGRKKMFLLGAFLFAAGSLIASLSHSVGMLLFGDSIIEGIGAALMMPATSSLIVANYEGRDRAVAFGVWGGVAALALAIGPILGGFLTSNYSWRWGFRINLLVVALIFLGASWLRDTVKAKKHPNIDWFGIILSSLGLLSVVFGIIEASEYGWWKATEIFSIGGTAIPLFANLSISVEAFVLGIALLLGFILWELRVESRGRMPLVSIHLFENKQFVSGILTQTVISLGQAGAIFSVTLFLQAVQGRDALETGFSLLPLAITLFLSSMTSGYLSRKISPKTMIMVGLLLNGLSLLWLREVLTTTVTLTDLILPLGLYGIGIGMIISQITNLTLSSVAVEDAGEASGVNSTLQRVGQTLGSAIVGAVLLSSLTSTLTTNLQNNPLIPDTLKPGLIERIEAQHSNIEFGGASIAAADLSPETKSAVLSDVADATVSANRKALLTGTFIVAIGFITASFLKVKKRPEELAT